MMQSLAEQLAAGAEARARVSQLEDKLMSLGIELSLVQNIVGQQASEAQRLKVLNTEQAAALAQSHAALRSALELAEAARYFAAFAKQVPGPGLAMKFTHEGDAYLRLASALKAVKL